MSLADVVLSLAPIERQLAEPLGLLAGDGAAVTQRHFDAIAHLFAAAGLRPPRAFADRAALGPFDRAAQHAFDAAGVGPQDLGEPVAALAAARLRGVDGVGTRRQVQADGAALSTFAAGDAGRPVLLIGAPGMPIEMMAAWLRGLAHTCRVLSWETRGLFGPGSEQVANLGINAQVADAEAVMRDAGWSDAHVVGICGGAVLALAYAARFPQRVRSLVLWCGDYDLGGAAPKTEHQSNLQGLMQMVVERRVSAQALRDVLVGSMAQLSEPDLAPLALYPFANPALLNQYCKMNYPIMSTDCRHDLAGVTAPCMVGYSPDDNTTHPEGSRVLARMLNARLEAMRGAGHLSSLRGQAEQIALITAFQNAQ